MAAAHAPAHLVPTDAELPAMVALERAFEQGDAAGVVALLRTHERSACIQAAACSALSELLKRNQETRAAVVAAGALKPLLEALHAHSGVVELLDPAVYTLARLFMESPQRDADTAMAASLGAVEIVVDALLEHTCIMSLAQNAMGALSVLTSGDQPERSAAAIAAGAAEALVRALHTHLTSSQLQKNGLQLLCNFLRCSAADVQRICAAGAVNVSLVALREHPEDADVQEVGWHLLHELCQHDQAHGAAGVFAAAAATLRVHAAPTRMHMHELMCRTVAGFTREHAGNQRLALEAGVIDALITLLRRTTSTTPFMVVSLTFVALCSSMSHCADAVLQAGRMGAVEVVVKAMRAHSSAASVLHASGCHALFQLVHGNEDNMTAALRAGAVRVVQAATRTCGDDAHREGNLDYMRHVLRVLREGEASETAAADAAMAALLAEEEAERAGRPAAPRKAKSKSGKKKKRGGSGSGGAHRGAAASDAAADAAPDDYTHEPNAPAANPAATALGAGVDAQEDDIDFAAAIAATAALAPDRGGAGAASGAPPPSSDEAAGGAQAAAPLQYDTDADESASRSPPAQQSEQPPMHAPPPLPAPAPLPAPRTMAPRRYEPPVGGASPMTCAAEAAAADVPMQQQRHAAVSLGAASGAAQLPSYLAHLVLSAPPAQAPPQPALVDAPPQLPPLPPPVPALKECCVCLDDVAQADLLLLMPCAHRCVCQACADALMAILPPAPRRCPKCREPVWRASRVFED
jgi:hypothetical protein